MATCGAGDLLALDGEDAEGEAVLAHAQDRGGGRDDGALAARVAEDLLEGLALGGGEVGGGGRRRARARSLPAPPSSPSSAAAACAGEKRRRAARQREQRSVERGGARVATVGCRAWRRRRQRAALVTGGSSGIGLAIARALAEDGYGITLSARRPEKLAAAGDAMRDDGFDVLDVPAQMTEEEELRTLVEAHAERFGRLDVLVNNAGVGIGEAMDELTTKKVDMQLGRQPAGDHADDARVPADAAGGGRRAPQGADREHGLDRGEVAPAVAVGLLGDQGGGARRSARRPRRRSPGAGSR